MTNRGERPAGRFIAGASCPRCGAMDRLQMDRATGQRRWCVACDFDEVLAPELANDPGEAVEQVLELRASPPRDDPGKNQVLP